MTEFLLAKYEHLTQLQMHRHGSRGPANAGEMVLIDSLVQTLRDGRDALQDAYLPENLRFLQTGMGYESHLDPENMTIIGRQQLFNHGVEFGVKYPNFTTETVLSSKSPRVFDSMYFFAQGRFGREVEDKNLLSVDVIPGPMANEWSDSYLPSITKRLNDLLPYGVSSTDNDTHGALYACSYDLAAGDESPYVGYLAPNDARRVLGSVFVKELINRFSNTGGEVQSLYLEFGHNATIMAAMDLNKDEPPLSSEELRQRRRFRTSYQTLAAQMIWERFTYIPLADLRKNQARSPIWDLLTGCIHKSQFQSSTHIEFDDDTWQAACGAHSEVFKLKEFNSIPVR
ncbi:phosphoglycerate mutase-like protein [Suillus placidus]|uniref:Phosphoglycerate mutase-like protein n=1 Tax=Suillus placidus TaxID=48579 RepID=A0A9P7A594_9AGAM|nr:phosphoglycerate mutase-like protein [Suillus placidus]